jgi:hypothetical protein
MAPDTFFEKLKDSDDNQVVYWKRCCSMFDYYVMLSEDTPGYKPKVLKVNNRPNPRDYRPAKHTAYNPYISSNKALVISGVKA